MILDEMLQFSILLCEKFKNTSRHLDLNFSFKRRDGKLIDSKG
jgi:hypothetical protein